MPERGRRRVRIVQHQSKTLRPGRRLAPGEFGRDVLALTCVTLRDWLAVLKGRARQLEHVRDPVRLASEPVGVPAPGHLWCRSRWRSAPSWVLLDQHSIPDGHAGSGRNGTVGRFVVERRPARNPAPGSAAQVVTLRPTIPTTTRAMKLMRRAVAGSWNMTM